MGALSGCLWDLPSHYIFNIIAIMARYPTKHKSATRERILAAAERVIKDRGVERASVDAVMRGADLTVGGFYAHFDTKEHLAREALLFGLERSMERLLTPLTGI